MKKNPRIYLAYADINVKTKLEMYASGTCT